MENMQPHIKENKIHHKRIPKNVGSQKYVQSLKIMRGITFSFKTIFQKSNQPQNTGDIVTFFKKNLENKVMGIYSYGGEYYVYYILRCNEAWRSRYSITKFV